MAAVDTRGVRISRFDPYGASEDEWRALGALLDRLHAERSPDDPPNSLEQRMGQMRNVPGFIDFRFFGAWNAGQTEMIGFATNVMLLTEENQHLAHINGGVSPEWRRKGIGTSLLATLLEVIESANRRLLIASSHGCVPAGAAFLAAIGGTVGLEAHENRLDLADLNRELIGRWIAGGTQRNPELQLGFWEGAYPEDEIEAIAKLMESINNEPRGSLDVEDSHWTAEHVRQQQESLLQRGAERWTIYARDTTNGELAGFTEVVWNPEKAAYLEQHFTAVWPRYQNRGLGRWLKAAMLDKVLRERPQVRFVSTGNADSNGPMLKINHELGFKPHQAEQVWQVEVARAREYLAGRET